MIVSINKNNGKLLASQTYNEKYDKEIKENILTYSLTKADKKDIEVKIVTSEEFNIILANQEKPKPSLEEVVKKRMRQLAIDTLKLEDPDKWKDYE